MSFVSGSGMTRCLIPQLPTGTFALIPNHLLYRTLRQSRWYMLEDCSGLTLRDKPIWLIRVQTEGHWGLSPNVSTRSAITLVYARGLLRVDTERQAHLADPSSDRRALGFVAECVKIEV